MPCAPRRANLRESEVLGQLPAPPLLLHTVAWMPRRLEMAGCPFLRGERALPCSWHAASPRRLHSLPSRS